jgi:hypothetical protein
VRALVNAPGCLDLYLWLVWRCFKLKRDAQIPLFGAYGLLQQLGTDDYVRAARSAPNNSALAARHSGFLDRMPGVYRKRRGITPTAARSAHSLCCGALRVIITTPNYKCRVNRLSHLVFLWLARGCFGCLPWQPTASLGLEARQNVVNFLRLQQAIVDIRRSMVDVRDLNPAANSLQIPKAVGFTVLPTFRAFVQLCQSSSAISYSEKLFSVLITDFTIPNGVLHDSSTCAY